MDDSFELDLVGRSMQDHPPKADVGLTQAIHQGCYLIQYELLSQHTFSQELPTFDITFGLLEGKLIGELLYAFDVQDVGQCQPG